ncbi:MAG: hypothetical protein GY778_27010 [bacterium]|nr:hypothetical protein [bacterium]
MVTRRALLRRGMSAAAIGALAKRGRAIAPTGVIRALRGLCGFGSFAL